MATLNTIESSFAAMAPEQKKANLLSLSYIRQLASITRVNISRWDILKTFGQVDGINLITDKKEINKAFFSKMEKLAEDTAEDVVIPDKLLEVIKNKFLQTIEERKSGLHSTIRAQRASIDRAHNDMQLFMGRLVNAQKELKALEGGTEEPLETIKQELADVLKAGYWSNPVMDDNYLYLNTKTDIVLTYKNKVANVAIELNVGQFAVKIDLSTLSLLVIPYKNNIVLRGDYRIYHPHVSTEGAICWGSALPLANKLREELKLGKVLEILYALLSSYNDENPYTHLHALKVEHRKYSRPPAALMHPDRVKKEATAADAEEESQEGLAPMPGGAALGHSTTGVTTYRIPDSEAPF